MLRARCFIGTPFLREAPAAGLCAEGAHARGLLRLLLPQHAPPLAPKVQSTFDPAAGASYKNGCRKSCSSRKCFVFDSGFRDAVFLDHIIEVLVAAAGKVDEHRTVLHLLCKLHGERNSMGAFNGGDDAFQT